MSALLDYFLKSSTTVVQLELIEISHSSFSQVYRFVRNHTSGVTVTLETAASADFEYYPLRIRPTAIRNTLDFVLNVDLGDVGEILPTELDNVFTDDSFGEKPEFIYRVYRDDDLTAPMLGPIRMYIDAVSFTKEGCSFQAKAASLNINKTGILYDNVHFPMLVDLK